MKNNLLVSIIALAISCSGWAANIPFIVGGEQASPGEVPFMVSLQSGGRHFCGASLIKKNWALTAGHCVRGQSTRGLTVVIGAYSLGQRVQAETFPVEKVVVHPGYNGNTINDFALLKIGGQSRGQVVELNRTQLNVPTQGAPLVATAAGFGYIKQNGWNVEKTLRKVNLPLVSQQECNRAYNGKITDQMICAGKPQGGIDTCQGDSGGPLFLKRSQSQGGALLIGVVSWGEGCARPNKYGVYARVSSAISWIQQVTTMQ